jgi:hypothetical protein
MDQLITLYKEKLELIDEHLKNYNSRVSTDKKATNPFFITTPGNYDVFSNRIMIFGQETNSWCNECGNNSEYSKSLDKSIEIYIDFFLKGGINSYRGPFWNEFKRIKNESWLSKNAVFLWNNVNKIGRVGKGNIQELNDIQFKLFQIIRDEIKFLKPNIMVFLTGPEYDNFIKKNIGEFDQKKIQDDIWEISFKDKALNDIRSFKTYHPNALYFQSKNGIVIPKLINEIKKACI